MSSPSPLLIKACVGVSEDSLKHPRMPEWMANMDTQNTSDPVSWLSLAKKHFKPKTIEVIMVATTSPFMQDDILYDRYRATYRYVHVLLA